MPLDNVPGQFVVPTRPELVADYERDYRLIVPDAVIGEGTPINVDAKVQADALLPLYTQALKIARLGSLEDMTGDQLEDAAEDLGLPRRLAATGARGFVRVTTSAGGAAIVAGQEAVHSLTGTRYAADETGLKLDGDSVALVGITSGPITNLPAGSVLDWVDPPAGLAQRATVTADGNGDGLIGGRDEETNEEIVDRIRDARANPSASGNEAAYRKAVRETPGVPVQAAFTTPALFGPGTIGVFLLLRPSGPGGTRIANADQMAAVSSHVRLELPGDDSPFFFDVFEYPLVVALRVRWARGVSGWTDATPWPPYVVSDAAKMRVNGTPTSPTAFQVTDGNNGSPAPAIGNTIAFWDRPKNTFRRKRILTVTAAGAGTWNVTCDTSNNASDQTYTPESGQAFGPWSDSLQPLALPMVGEFDKLGPGEQATFFDVDKRRRRQPESPEQWPSVLTARALVPLYDLPALSSVEVAQPTFPYETPLPLVEFGFPRLLVLSNLLVFPQ
jgi:uncharacterized phage protein gp47/JayE